MTIDKTQHVDDFIDYGTYNNGMDAKDKEAERYARWFLHLKRLPAILKIDFDEYINQYKLFCIWKGKKYRVTGCSRLGDVWLHSNFKTNIGYEHRVNVKECSNWTKD